jgi:ABC-type protease/lipase transport system fused ATPase/permease subunit
MTTMERRRAQQVFTPSSYPTLTYVVREDNRHENTLRESLQTPGQITSIIGPSKSGKTVLVEKVVGLDHLIRSSP